MRFLSNLALILLLAVAIVLASVTWHAILFSVAFR